MESQYELSAGYETMKTNFASHYFSPYLHLGIYLSPLRKSAIITGTQ